MFNEDDQEKMYSASVQRNQNTNIYCAPVSFRGFKGRNASLDQRLFVSQPQLTANFLQIDIFRSFMKVKREMSSGDYKKDDEALSGSSVHNRLGRSWNRAENRLDRSSRHNKRESPRKVRKYYENVYFDFQIFKNSSSSRQFHSQKCF